mgnify:CR=1 FL=1
MVKKSSRKSVNIVYSLSELYEIYINIQHLTKMTKISVYKPLFIFSSIHAPHAPPARVPISPWGGLLDPAAGQLRSDHKPNRNPTYHE